MQYTLYKANKKNNGAATTFQLSDNGVFFTSTNQIGVDDNENAKFGWTDKEKTIIFKVGPSDLGELLALFRGKKNDAVKLFHENKNGNTSLTVTPGEWKGQALFSYRIFSKNKDGKTTSVQHAISMSEASILETMFSAFLLKLLSKKS